MATKAELVEEILAIDETSEATESMSHDDLTALLKLTKELEKDEQEVEVEVEVHKLTNNTKGLRGVAGIKILPGESVELTREQVEMVNKNPCAMDWIKSGDLSLA